MNDENTWDFPATSNGGKVVPHELYFQLLSVIAQLCVKSSEAMAATHFSQLQREILGFTRLGFPEVQR